MICTLSFSVRLFSVVRYESVIHEVLFSQNYSFLSIFFTFLLYFIEETLLLCFPLLSLPLFVCFSLFLSHTLFFLKFCFLYALFFIILSFLLVITFIFFQFDPYFNYRSTIYLLKKGIYSFLNWFDDRSWYPLGRPTGTTVLLFYSLSLSLFSLFSSFSFSLVVYYPIRRRIPPKGCNVTLKKLQLYRKSMRYSCQLELKRERIYRKRGLTTNLIYLK